MVDTYSNSAAASYRLQGPANTTGGGSSGIGQGLTAIGGVTSAYATYMAGKANKRIARFNAAYSRQQASQAIEAGEFNAGRIDLHGKQVAAAGEAAQAAGGTVVGAGTSAAVAESNREATQMDVLMTRLNARREAYGYQVKAAGDTMQGNLAQQTGEMNAGATLLNTGSKLWLEGDANYERRIHFGMGG